MKPSKMKNIPKKYSTKIKHLFSAHEDSERFKENKLELLGVLDMVAGLEYHHNNFMKMERKSLKLYQKMLEEKIFFSSSSQNIIHEAVAYLNRLGQLEALFASKWFQKYACKNSIAYSLTTFFALMPFRNKFSAHRSLDKPWSEETSSQRLNHAKIPFGLRMSGSISDNFDPLAWNPNVNVTYQMNIPKSHRHQMLKNISANESIEKFSGEEIWITFIPAKHYQIILNEIVSAIEIFFI